MGCSLPPGEAEGNSEGLVVSGSFAHEVSTGLKVHTATTSISYLKHLN